MLLTLLFAVVVFIDTAIALHEDKNKIHLDGDACGRGTLAGPERYNFKFFYKDRECHKVHENLRLGKIELDHTTSR